jgi:hypothetical protein
MDAKVDDVGNKKEDEGKKKGKVCNLMQSAGVVGLG